VRASNVGSMPSEIHTKRVRGRWETPLAVLALVSAMAFLVSTVGAIWKTADVGAQTTSRKPATTALDLAATPSRPKGAGASLRQDTLAITQSRGLNMGTVVKGIGFAFSNNAVAGIVHQGTIEVLEVRRGASTVQSFPDGESAPVSMMAVTPDTASPVLGPDIASVLMASDAVLSVSSASLRSAKVGDTIMLRGWDSNLHLVRVGSIVDDGRALNAEILVSLDTARSFGVDRPERLLIWKIPSKRDAFVTNVEKTLAAENIRVTASWTPPSVDKLLSQAQLKLLLGEFTIRRNGKSITVNPQWLAANVGRMNLPTIGDKSCHKLVLGPLKAALSDVEFVGLDEIINVADTAKAGNCFNGREIRTNTGTSGRNLSRHSWAAAIDINPSTNPFGGKPTIHPCIVEIFRAHGFAWGGSFSIPDGMHFEFTGAASKPLPACAVEARRINLATTTTTTSTTTTTTTTTPSTTTLPTTIPASIPTTLGSELTTTAATLKTATTVKGASTTAPAVTALATTTPSIGNQAGEAARATATGTTTTLPALTPVPPSAAVVPGIPVTPVTKPGAAAKRTVPLATLPPASAAPLPTTAPSSLAPAVPLPATALIPSSVVVPVTPQATTVIEVTNP
jgi:D-alanyl-D-alanine carboxypeptidase